MIGVPVSAVGLIGDDQLWLQAPDLPGEHPCHCLGVRPGEGVGAGVRIGEVDFRAAGPIARCVMTTLDPDTLARGREPIATLARTRRWSGRTWLGRELVALTTGTIRVGDRVEPY